MARVQMMPSLSEATDWRLKSEALAHLSIGFVHPLTTCFSVLLLPYLYFRSFSATTALSTAIDLATACFLVAIPLACYFASQYFRTGRFSDCWRGVAFLPALLTFGFGMNLHYTYAFIEGLLYPGGEFERTPKGGHAARNSGLLRRFTTARRSKVLITGELAMGMLLGLGAISLWPAVPVHWLLLVSLFSFGYLWIGAQSLYESLRLR